MENQPARRHQHDTEPLWAAIHLLAEVLFRFSRRMTKRWLSTVSGRATQPPLGTIF
jgi:hypothetical protein